MHPDPLAPHGPPQEAQHWQNRNDLECCELCLNYGCGFWLVRVIYSRETDLPQKAITGCNYKPKHTARLPAQDGEMQARGTRCRALPCSLSSFPPLRTTCAGVPDRLPSPPAGENRG